MHNDAPGTLRRQAIAVDSGVPIGTGLHVRLRTGEPVRRPPGAPRWRRPTSVTLFVATLAVWPGVYSEHLDAARFADSSSARAFGDVLRAKYRGDRAHEAGEPFQGFEPRDPAGTSIFFRDPSVWERYRIYIVGAVALLFTQSALIVALLIQAARRHRVERRLQASQAELSASYERIRDLGRQLLRAQEDERARISRELHDDISQQIAVLGIDLAMLETTPLPGSGRIVADAYERTQAVARRVRDLSHRLHPSNLALVGLPRALERLAHDFANAGLTITFTHGEVPDGLPTDVTLCLFRVAQEALQNVIKHSGARAATVHLESVRHELWLTVVDEGVGCELRTAGRGLGLISMEERVSQLGGTLHVRSTPGAGTGVHARVPIPAAQRETTVA